MMSTTSSHQYRINQSFIFALVISMLALTASYALEIIEKIPPCRICMAQRICIFFTMFFAILGVFSSMKYTVCSIIFVVSLTSFVMACYHIGIQMGLFSDSCTTISPISLNEFKTMLFKSQPSCSSITWIFGLPISAWNLLISASIGICAMAALWRSSDRSLSFKRSQYLH